MSKSKQKTPKKNKKHPSYQEHNSKGTDGNPFDGRTTKEALLARMKAAADKNK